MDEKILYEARKLIAGFIVARRRELGITQEQLAEKCGVGIATIKRLELGKFWLNLKQLLIICHSLDLFFFVGEKESDEDYSKVMRERWGKITNN
ncbi:MAG: helix-turn-helix domain-containing protein [Clostridia bacterium]|nr:helix-turn-helix domain-containing protein [Clostridia bacterium]